MIFNVRSLTCPVCGREPGAETNVLFTFGIDDPSTAPWEATISCCGRTVNVRSDDYEVAEYEAKRAWRTLPCP